jgi:hypothetical protein
MLIFSHYITETLVASFIFSWICYSIIVVIYLNYLTNKYLVPQSRDMEINNKPLKNYKDLIEQYKNTDTLNLLVLSGGGVRGLVPLHILTYIEHKTGKKAGELFDFIAGSSTGAITAAGLCVGDEHGGYKFSAKEIFDAYESNSRKIFSSPWYHQWFTFFGLFAPRYLPDRKLSVLDYYYKDLTISELKGNLLIPIYNIEQNNLQIVKNWEAPHGNIHANYLTKDLVNGASSPPMLFPPVAFSINGKNHMFIDPAVLLNNPLLHIMLYVRAIFPEKKLNIVLLGNGSTASAKYNYKNMFSFGLYGLYQYLFSAPALSSKLFIEFMEEYLVESQEFDQRVEFYRINSNPDDDLSPVDTSHKNLKNIQKYANKMLQENYDKLNSLSSNLLDNLISRKVTS